MGGKQVNKKVSKTLKGNNMEEKVKLAFSSVIKVFLLNTALCFLCIIIMFVRMAKNNMIAPGAVLSIIGTIVMTVISIRVSITLAKKLTKEVVDPIRELQGAVQKLRVGDLNIEIAYESQDEIGELADDLRATCTQMQTVIEDAGYLLGEMSEGNFNITSKAEDSYVGEFELLITGINNLNLYLDETLREIREASELVMSSSEQMAYSAQDLAEGATNQASAVEELNATVDDVTNISVETADNVTMAATNAKTAAEDAKKSREEINQLTAAMERITETSKEIEKIIGAIEDIASQTNLLSLNASIEAARAGEAGRGFAVVADQIGKLASDSAQSAVTTRELISKSLVEIEMGNEIVEHTMESIGNVLANMEEFANMASSAAESSRVQADMLKQIEEGIEQVSNVIQSNSAAAQETSAVSEELSSESISLEEMLEKFQLRKK